MDKQQNHQVDVIWGIEDISQAIGQSFAATAYMLKKGHIPAKKVGDRWAASRKALNEFFAGEAA
ncbi:MAG: DNA-binding protein [Ochrobactrum anthropi]|uniref:DNA-binding protein n=1 Tax=Brucella anthropi TaxID=529 RepID=A0A8I0N1D8_BRUAN|nr:DNA-binding protein [Brucella anthropi]MBE0559924.1 DNA-binding protein [Brucella anthropi]